MPGYVEGPKSDAKSKSIRGLTGEEHENHLDHQDLGALFFHLMLEENAHCIPKSTGVCDGGDGVCFDFSQWTLTPAAEIDTCGGQAIAAFRFRKVLFGYFLFKEKVPLNIPKFDIAKKVVGGQSLPCVMFEDIT